MYSITALPTDTVTALRQGGLDAFGSPLELHISDEDGTPCRHCLRDISKGAGMLILAYKPFEGTHPYAQVRPIFLCADACPRGGGVDLPQILRTSPDYLFRGYGPDDRIVYGTGAICPAGTLRRVLVPPWPTRAWPISTCGLCVIPVIRRAQTSMHRDLSACAPWPINTGAYLPHIGPRSCPLTPRRPRLSTPVVWHVMAVKGHWVTRACGCRFPKTPAGLSALTATANIY